MSDARPILAQARMVLVGAGLMLACSAAPPTHAAPAGPAVGPTFDCATARDPVAAVICTDDGLKRRDVAFVQAYQALRHQLAEAQREGLREDARTFHAYVARECRLPPAGPVPPGARAQAVACVDRAYANKRADYAKWLGREASEEAARDAGEHVELQRALAGVAGAGSVIPLNGVYGQATRDALRMFQGRAGLAQNGFLDNATAMALRQPGSAAPPTFVPPVQAAPRQPPAPAAMPLSPAATVGGPPPPASPPVAQGGFIAGLPCSAVTMQQVRQARWARGQILFGLPYERWTKDDYEALTGRIEACLVENRDDPRQFTGMRRFLDIQAGMAPDPRGDEARRIVQAREEAEKAERARLEREEAGRRRAAEDQYHAARAADMQRDDEARRVALRQATLEAAAREPAFDCADRATLREVQRLLEEQSNQFVTIRVLKLYDPGLTAEHAAINESTLDVRGRYRAAGATSPEERNLVRIQIGLPRCAARALTNHGDSILGYEKIERGGQLFLRIRPDFL